MYGITEDVGFLVGRRIEAVQARQYRLDLLLDGDHRITIEGDVTFSGIRSAASGLRKPERLTGRRIAGVEVVGGRDLCLSLDDGGLLVLHDDSECFESFNITAPGVNIIV